MERGELGVADQPTTVFVFEDLIATCSHPRLERASIMLERWARALDYWTLEITVVDYMHDFLARLSGQIEVITYRPPAFAQVVHDRLWDLDVPVSDVTSVMSYQSASQRFAIDPRIQTVYDPDPAHRYGYGFKAREFALGLV